MCRCVLVLFLCCASCIAQNAVRLVVRLTGGLTQAQSICTKIGCNVVRGLNDPQSQLYLVSLKLPINTLNLLSTLSSMQGIRGVEIDSLISLRDPQLITPLGAPAGAAVWNGYSHQPAAGIVRADDARSAYHVSGAGTVAIIDTGVDPNHPALQGVLVPGYDFTRNQPGGSETADLNQSTAAVVDGCPGGGALTLNQSTAAVVDGCGSAEFGHGTMVAGIVHMIAPTAPLMPLKCFGPGGQGYLSDIIRAVYWAAGSNARVINMSFSTPFYSQEFRAAIDYARSRNMISVAAAGNNGNAATVYPAGFPGVMDVASTTLNDRRSSFSNFGSSVWVAAPGENIVSTFPFGTYASGSGTSFSAPFVAGTAALILQEQPSANETIAADAIGHAQPVGGSGLGHGRLDVFMALTSVQH